MALLVGRHLNKIDKKGRVSVPKSFREAAVEEGFPGVYIYPFFKYPALEGGGEAFLTRLSASLNDSLEMFSDEQEELTAITLENTFKLNFDPEGRITLPGQLCRHAGLDGHALFVGHGNRFQIWSPDTHLHHRDGALEKAKASGVTLKLSPTREVNRDGGG